MTGSLASRLRLAAAVVGGAVVVVLVATTWAVISPSTLPAVVALATGVAALLSVGWLLVMVSRFVEDVERLTAIVVSPEEPEPPEALPRELAYVARAHRRLAAELETARAERVHTRDPVTGSLSSAEVELRIAAEVDRARRHGGVVSLVVVEFDDPEDGTVRPLDDRTLQICAGALEDAARPSDVVGRHGDGFAILLPHADADGAVAAAERFRDRVGRTSVVRSRGGPAGLVARMGVATFPNGSSSPEDLVDAALEGVDRARETHQAVARGRA